FCFLSIEEKIYLQQHRRLPYIFELLQKYSLWPPTPSLADPIQYNPVNGPSPFIIGGDTTTIESYPYQLSLRNGGVHICGASIISDKWSLSAAHCLDDGSSPSWITFRGGSPHRLVGGYIFHAVRYILHEQFDPRTFNCDVAVIEIAENFFVDFLQPIPLTDGNIKVSCPSNLATVIGWGTAAYDYVPLILQELQVLIQPGEVCNKVWIEQVTSNMLCAGGVIGQDTCNGDSGGPLICDGYQMGIVSWGSQTCAIAMPAVFTNVSDPNIRDFIRTQAGV
ncbi:chymotrypsin-1-like, partial [Ochlerotatus camptorhynchus]|uniref:chymotrypsin-1-like n=1 Tax=Ochlerotatus camptorhynchus TaxID=644619 RepID=UPI0031D3594F